jgi:hypothetical protein
MLPVMKPAKTQLVALHKTEESTKAGQETM